jgi:hypothetical protein
MIDEYFVEKIFDSIMAYGGELELSSPYQPEGRDIRRIKVASFRHNFDEGNLKHVDWNTYVEMVRNVVEEFKNFLYTLDRKRKIEIVNGQ